MSVFDIESGAPEPSPKASTWPRPSKTDVLSASADRHLDGSPGSLSPRITSRDGSPRATGSPRTASPRMSSPLLSAHRLQERKLVETLSKEIPPELQGVSVKDLVKALGKSPRSSH